MTVTLRKAILVSVLVHGAVLISLRQPVWSLDPTSQAPSRTITALLHSAERAKPVSPPFESLSASAEKSLVTSDDVLKKSGPAKKALDLSSLSRSTATEDVAVTDKAVVVSGEVAHASNAGVDQAGNLDLDGVRQYRLSLAREARRFKHYPDLARDRGLEGVVVLVVTTAVGKENPQVSLSQSSGSYLLDQAALDLLEIAVRTAILPDSLRGHQFALTLPIHFRIDD